MVTATGDFQGNLEKLRDELKKARFDGELALELLSAGDPVGVLPLLHFALLRFSKHVSRWLVERGYDLYGKTDLRFVEAVYRLARQEFGYRHALTCKQFLSVGFAERKLIFVVDLLQLCRAKHLELGREASATRRVPGNTQRGDASALSGLRAAAAAGAAPPVSHDRAKPVQPHIQRHVAPGHRLRGDAIPAAQCADPAAALRMAQAMAEHTVGGASAAGAALSAVADRAAAGRAAAAPMARDSDCPMPAPFPPAPYPAATAVPPPAPAPTADEENNDISSCFLTQRPVEAAPCADGGPRHAWEPVPAAPARAVAAAAPGLVDAVPPPAPPPADGPCVPAPLDEQPLSILPIPTLPSAAAAAMPPAPLASGPRLCFSAAGVAPSPAWREAPLHGESAAAPAAAGPAAEVEVAALRQEVAELRRLLTHACTQIDALTADRAASSAEHDARLTLLEGQFKLMQAAAPPAPPPPPTPAAAPAAAPPAPAPKSEPSASARVPLGSLRDAPPPRRAADGGPAFGMPPKLTATTYKSSFAEYVSTQEFITDMSRRFTSTQQLLLDASRAEA